MPADPVLVEVRRGDHVESRHRGAAVVTDAAGRLVFAVGDVARLVFPRSAIKLIQALPLVESGAADALGLSTADLALAGASHNGEPRHVAGAAAMLARVGRDETCLVCGAQWPQREDDRGRLHIEGRTPTRLHNNCSGKHAGFVCFAVHAGIDPAGYGAVDHPVQRTIAAAIEDVVGVSLADTPRGRDGCSIPTWALPLDGLARGFARLGSGTGLAPTRARAARRLIDAAIAEPFMVAGTGRFCTEMLTAAAGRVYVKTGAEGVFCAALPDLGLGLAVKIADGATRAAEVVTATLLAALLGRRDDPAFDRFLRPPIVDWNGATVGGVAAIDGLAADFAP
ncbi:asparaginase [Siculibacillus lacustris]|uniref:asparaginase n=1 Tax=Siculibacillus lacustris TaxID=1549641 RepID=UPI001D18EBA8|nr:asparaginase [Siculibacillus lacustris]